MARELYEFGPFQLDPVGRRLLRHGESVSLTPKAFDTLLVLLVRREQRLSREELISQVWPDTAAGEHNLNQCIAVLRKALDDNPRQPNYIATLPGHGYSFIAEVHCVAAGNNNQRAHVLANGNSIPDSLRPWRFAVAGLAMIAFTALIMALPLGSRGRSFAESVFFFASPRSVSVLPFEDFGASSTESEKQYLASGLSQELTAELGQLRGIKVIVGRLTSPVSPEAASASAAWDPKSAARSLHVESLLKGTVRRSNEQYRIAVQLIDGRDGRELWSGVYAADIADIPSVEEQIIRHTAEALRVPWSASTDEQWARRHTENPEAHDLYLQARYLWSKRYDDDVRRSIVLLQQAITKDPAYARAYAGLADSYAVLAINNHDASAVPLARDAARKALQLDPTLAEPHATLGALESKFDWDFADAQEEFRRCFALNSGYATGHHWAGLNLIAMGQFAAADDELRKAQELDPLSPMISEGRFENYYSWHRFDEGLQTIRALQARNPAEYAGYSWAIAAAYRAKGMYREADPIVRQRAESEPNTRNILGLAQLQALEGDRVDARATVESVKNRPDRDLQRTSFAKVHLALGETDAAIAWLQRAYQEHDPEVPLMKYDPDFAPLAADPRFQQLVQNIGTRDERVDATNR
jgi:DNA-binding winged helix-turn-helix (wHTH) protein/TolB-like protein